MTEKLSKKDWYAAFNAEFLRRTSITYEDGGGDFEDAVTRYYPEEVKECVAHHIEKYDMDDILEGGGYSIWR